MIHIVHGMLREEFILLRRYPLNAISGVVTMYLIFLMFFFGVQSAVGPGMGMGDTAASLVVGYWVMVLTNLAFQNLGYYLAEQAMVGTLEQLYMSPYGFWPVALGKMIGTFTQNLVLNIPLLAIMMLTTGQRFHFDLVSMAPLILMAVLQAYGIGLIMAGLTLLYKRLQSLYQLVSMGMVVFIAAPPETFPWAYYLPLNIEWRLLREIMADGLSLVQLPMAYIALSVAKTTLLFGVGWSVYYWCDRLAHRKGVIGQY